MQRIGLAALLAMAPAPALASSLELVPEQPREFAPINVLFERPTCTRVDEVRHEQGHIRIYLDDTVCGLPPPGTISSEVSIGRLPAGTYVLQLARRFPTGSVIETREFSVRRSRLELEAEFSDEPVGRRVDLSGAWWNPQRPGEGMFIEHSTDGNAFVVLNRYRADGTSMFHVASLTVTEPRLRFPLSGLLLEVILSDEGPQYEAVGEVTLATADRGRVELRMSEPGQPERTLEFERIGL